MAVTIEETLIGNGKPMVKALAAIGRIPHQRDRQWRIPWPAIVDRRARGVGQDVGIIAGITGSCSQVSPVVTGRNCQQLYRYVRKRSPKNAFVEVLDSMKKR